MEYWDEKSLEYKYQMAQVFEQQLEDIQEIVYHYNILCRWYKYLEIGIKKR